jgi:hypothetical protein
MEVMIDGVRYVPMPEPPTGKRLTDALELRFDSDAGEQLTVRDYLRELLQTLWMEGEGFSGKRPFGNSGWAWELYGPLVRDGFIEGAGNGLDEYVDMTPDQERAAHDYVNRLIAAAFVQHEA